MSKGTKSLIIAFVLGFVLISSPIASRGEKQIGRNIVQISNGRTLYVGGNGPGNYSKIQDAVDNASNDDIVFVYHNSSPYYENILINKSITLCGENKTTTTIDAQGVGGNVVSITVDRVIFSGFSVLNCGCNLSSLTGIYVHSNNSKILGNTISNNRRGENALNLDHSSDNVIMGNNISNFHFGIVVFGSRNIIVKNFITDCFDAGVLLRFSNNNNISKNIIVKNTYGVDIGDSTSNNINSNEISHNTYGIIVSYSLKNLIIKNNFRENIGYDAYNIFSFQPFWRNTWNANYWDRAKLFPQIIFGYLESYKNFLIIIPWINVDWHPVDKSYNISMLN